MNSEEQEGRDANIEVYMGGATCGCFERCIIWLCIVFGVQHVR
jgi:hypothetical protein